MSVYAFSIDNFKRSQDEVDALMDLARVKLLELCTHGWVQYSPSSWSLIFRTHCIPLIVGHLGCSLVSSLLSIFCFGEPSMTWLMIVICSRSTVFAYALLGAESFSHPRYSRRSCRWRILHGTIQSTSWISDQSRLGVRGYLWT